MTSVLELCKMIDRSAIGTDIRESSLLFPIIEGVHVLALSLGLATMLPSGVLMFIATAVRCYGNTSFWLKMCFLATALVFHFTYFTKALRSPDSQNSHRRGRLAACGALFLWFGVGAAGRSIGFFG